MNRAIKNFHLPLPASLYAELRDAAASAGEPATKYAQELVRRGLEERRRSERRQQIAVYAASVAGSADDLDVDLESAGVDTLRVADR